MDSSSNQNARCPLCNRNIGCHFMYTHLRGDHRVTTTIGLRYLMYKALGDQSPLIANGNSTQKNICRFVIQQNNCSDFAETMKLCKMTSLSMESFCCNYEADLKELEDDVKEVLIEEKKVHDSLDSVWSRKFRK